MSTNEPLDQRFFSGIKVPKDKSVCHKCDNPSCVNISHLFIGSHSENVRDCVKKGRQKEIRKTHCAQGHEYDTENTKVYITKLGYRKRMCRKCIKIQSANRSKI